MHVRRADASPVWRNERAFSLVELMIVTAIVAILASVAIPAYINYVNRAIQSDGITALMTAKMDQEVFFEQYFQYARAVGCLPSLNTDPSCLGSLQNCATCAQTSFTTGGIKEKKYSVFVVSADAETFTMAATRRYYSYAPVDRIEVYSTQTQPHVVDPTATGFSLFDWIFK